MFAAKTLAAGIPVGCLVSAIINLGPASCAWAAESYASSMAGTMQQSGAVSSNATQASTTAASEFSGSSTSNSNTLQATHASAYDSSLAGAGSGLALKNVVGPGAEDGNAVVPNPGVKSLPGADVPVKVKAKAIASSSGGLIENDVKQKAADFAIAGGATTGAAVNNVSAAPKMKIQYWNQGHSHHKH